MKTYFFEKQNRNSFILRPNTDKIPGKTDKNQIFKTAKIPESENGQFFHKIPNFLEKKLPKV